jgi:hypothetical protein
MLINSVRAGQIRHVDVWRVLKEAVLQGQHLKTACTAAKSADS